MLKEAIEKLVSLKENKTYKIEGRAYSDNQLNLIEPPVYRPQEVQVRSLDGLTKLIKEEIEHHEKTIFVDVEKYNSVKVFTTYDDKNKRDYIYAAMSDTPNFEFGWRDHEKAMIAFRSQFVQNKGIEYVIGLIAKITDDNKVSSEDNGITQSVEVKKGISLKAKEAVKPIISLIPYRTFLEIDQPESEFLLRVNQEGQIGLFEADGGMWKLNAKQNIKYELETALCELISQKKVIVMG